MKFLKIALLFIGITSFAQGKVGAADIEFIVSQMPEMVEVEEQVQLYANQLEADLDELIEEYTEMRNAFIEAQENLNEEELRESQMELREKESNIQRFQQNGSRLMELKQQEFLRPLYNKVAVALNKIAEEQSYTYITQITQDMVYLDPNYDLTETILDELGIEVLEQTTEE